MRTQNKNNKILKFSIRKLSFGAAPVVIGALFFGSHVPSEALANENNPSVKYTYLAENELTESEKNLIKRSIPNNVKNNETYYMVYKKEAQTSTKPTTELKELPNTGQSSLPVAGLGIGTAVLVVLLMSKKHRNKVLSVVLIGAMGQSIVMPYQSFAFENKELVRYNTQTTVANSSELANGVINIDGYRYVGYFTLSDLGAFPQAEQKVLPKQTQPIVEPTQPQPEPTPKVEYKTTPEAAPKTLVENKPELKSTIEAVPFKTVEQPDATLPKGLRKVVQKGVNGEQIVFNEVTTVDGKESSKVIKTSITKQPVDEVIAIGTKEEVAPTPKFEYKTTPEDDMLTATVEKPELVVSTETVTFQTVEQPDAALPKGQPKVVQKEANGKRTILTEVTTVDGKQTSTVLENTITEQPVNEVIAVGTKEETTPAPKPEEVKPTPQPEKPEETKPEEKVDKTALKAQIDRALALVPADYSAASYEALKPTLAAAQNVYASDSVKQPEVDSETSKLKTAIDALSVDKTDLNKTIADAKSKTKEHYSDATWANLQTVLADAENVTNNPAAKQSEVNHIYEKLKAAIAGLNTDKTELEKQLADANSKTAADYSTASWNALEEAKNTAKAVEDNATATQAQIDEATKKLKAAIAGLNTDKTELEKQLADANSKTAADHSTASWNALEEAKNAAQAVEDNATATQAQIDEAAKKLKDAIDALKTDKTELEKQLAAANSKTASDFSPETWSALEAAKNSAQAVEDNATATQAQIDEAAKKLKAVIAALNVDKIKLQEQITVANQKQETDYSPKTWNDFKQAEIKAKEINNQTTPLPKQSEIDAATKALQDAIKALAVDKTALQNAINTANSKRKEEYTTQTWKTLEDVLAAVTPVNTDATATQSKVDEATRRLEEAIKNLAPLTEKPVLKFVTTDKKVLDKEVVAKYSLENPTKAKIKSITATLKKDGEVVKTIDLSENNLDALLDNLKYFQEYTLSTTMVYDRGNGDETETLTDQPIQLDLKKVEIKNIKETNLISVNEDGVEEDKSLLNSVPENLAPLYLRITTYDNKVTRLAVDKIEEVVKDGETFYKVIATAPDLVQHTDASKLANKYVHYIAKPKQKVNNAYYDFAELVEAIQNNPEGEYKIGQSLNATNIKPNGKSYITKKFKGTLTSTDGNRFAIHNLSSPLFDVIENSTIKDLIFSNVNINKPNTDQIATLAKDATNTTIENVKITGSIIGGNDVAGVVNNLNNGSKMKNVSVIGKLHTEGKKGWSISGLVNNQRKANIERVYTDVEITGEKARGSALVSTLDRGMDPMDVRANGHIKKAVAKGSINLKNNVETGGVITKNWPYGYLEDVVSYVKVSNAEKLYGSGDIGDDDFGFPYLNRVVSVAGEATGNVTRKNADKLKEISKEEADKRLESFNITSKDFEAPKLLVDKLNNTTSKADTYKDTEEYKAERELAYRNIEKLQPFYNKEWIVNQGNKIPTGSNLLTKEVLSVTGMKDGRFVTDLSDINKIMIHYADGTKEEMGVTSKDSKVAQVREYSISGLDDIVYTPNMVDKDRTQLISDIKDKLSSFDLISPEVRDLMDKRNKAEENSENHKNNYIKNLFLEESFEEVRGNLDKLVKALVENEDHQLNRDDAAMKALLKKVEDNKAKIMMGLTYLNRYYGFKYDEKSMKDIMMFKPDFYGKNVGVLDFLIKVGSREHNIKGNRTLEAYREAIGGTIGIGELNGLLNYNMRLFTNETDINAWYKKAVSHTNYVVEKQSSNPLFANKKYHLYENLNNGEHSKYILPLLNTKKAHMFLISTYNTLAFSAFEKYGMNTEAQREEFKKQIDLRAQEQINYLDFWSRLAADNVRDRLLKSENMVPSAIWDNHGAPGGWVDRMGHTKNGDYAPIREFYGPTGKWHGDNGMGAYAYIFENPQNSEAVYYIWSSMISDFGTSAFTHETTHINDRMAYLGGWRHREGTDVEAFAQGMLQSPAVSSPNGDYGALGLNMAYKRENDGNQWYNYDPNKLNSREAIDHYMKNYNEALMMLDHLEADAVIAKNAGTNDKWFKRIDKKWRERADRNGLIGQPHQWDLVRDLNDEEKNLKLTTIDQLVDNNFATKHGLPGNGHYRAEGFDSAYTTVNMMTGIYGGNTSQSAVGSISFKHNTFRMWGYFGYLNGFLGYASNKYKQESKAAGNAGLGDDFIIDKVSGGKFKSLEAWKKAWYKEVYDKAQNGFVEIEINGEKISTYARLKELFNEAVEKDLQGNKFDNTVRLKEKVYKQLLQKSDGFAGKLFNE